jgi:hypothetical protein
MAIGRISGPLLKSNLVRDGVDLAFETDLLYLDVVNSRIGVNTPSPTTDLDVNGTTRTTTLTVDTQLDIGNFHISGNTITSDLQTISFQPSGDEPTIYHSRLQVDDIEIQGNTIATTVSNASLEFRPNGTGTLNIVGNTNITGNLGVTGSISATGNVTIGGNITIGDSLTDNIVINASIQSSLIPQTDNTYDLGSEAFQWRSVYTNNLYANTLNLPTLNIGNLSFGNNEITTTSGSDIYIDGNGTGGVRVGNFKFADNVITNITVNAVTQIIHTGNGYFKISGTNGFVPPVGTEGERPTSYAPVGMTRYNTGSKSLEIWDGFTWASPAGSSGAVSETDANEIAAIYALILG